MCHAYFSMRFEFVIDIFERRRIEIFINSCPEIVSHTFFNHCKAMTYEVALYVVCLLSVCLVNLRCPATSANSLLIRVLLSLPRHDDMMTTDFFLSFFFSLRDYYYMHQCPDFIKGQQGYSPTRLNT